jgi:HAD superfamily hydrolase (TIGR01509 family)
MVVDAIIFDLDGTLIDTEGPDFQSWQAVYRVHGLELTVDLWEQRVGWAFVGGSHGGFDPAVHLERLTGVRLDEATRQRQIRDYLERCETQDMLPGALKQLEEASARGIKLGIASNSDRKWVEYWLRHYDVRKYFTCVRTRDDVRMPKPAPDLYLSAAECLGVPVDRCIAVEDSPTGIKAVLAAGIRCIAVPNWLTARLERPPVHLTLASLADLDLSALLSRF